MITTNRNKATHRGTCQLCGEIQNLPNGRLANHGYKKEPVWHSLNDYSYKNWGWFEGNCPGTRGLPFEQSTDLIDSRIIHTETEISWKLRQADALEGSGATNMEVLMSVPETYGCSDRLVTLNLNEDGDVVFSYTNRFGVALTNQQIRPPNAVRDMPPQRDLEKAARHYNAAQAHYIRVSVSELTTYVEWLSERTANWSVSELIPISEALTTYVAWLYEPRRTRQRQRDLEKAARHYNAAQAHYIADCKKASGLSKELS